MLATLYNDLHPKTSLKNTGFKNKKKALNTIKLIRKRSPKYQFDVINTMLNRAKYHPHKTADMEKAMDIFTEWIKKYKTTKDKYEWLNLSIIDKYESLINEYNIKDKYNFLRLYKKLEGSPYKMQYILIDKNRADYYDYWSYRNHVIKKILNKMKLSNIPLFHKTGKNKNSPTKEHLTLIMYAYSPSKKLNNIQVI